MLQAINFQLLHRAAISLKEDQLYKASISFKIQQSPSVFLFQSLATDITKNKNRHNKHRYKEGKFNYSSQFTLFSYFTLLSSVTGDRVSALLLQS